jgi:UDP-3-O-[3-hydroxymyristoyl] glucosamine N-acyltransferase
LLFSVTFSVTKLALLLQKIRTFAKICAYMELSAQQIAAYLHGEVVGDASVTVNTFAKIEEGKPHSLSFLANPKYTQYIYETQASIVLVNKTFVPEKPINATLIKVEDAYKSLADLLTLVENNKPKKTGIDPLAYIAPSATIGQNVYIGGFAYIEEGVVIGDNCQIYPHTYIGEKSSIGKDSILYSGVKIYHQCVVGNQCIIHASSVIGADGFGFARNEDGSYAKIPQSGNVILEDNVEIGACTTIDRASMGSTIIHKGVKIDNQIQIAHNVELGENTAMAACSGIAGSTKVGKNCILAGMVGLAGHLNVPDNTIFAAYTGVPNNIKEAGIYQGIPAIPVAQFRRASVVYKQLPELQKTVYALQKEIELLKAELKK